MSPHKFTRRIIEVTLVMLLLIGCGTLEATSPTETLAATSTPEPTKSRPTAEPATATPLPAPATATSTPLPPTPTVTPVSSTSMPTAHGMNEQVCNEHLCLTATGAGDLGKSFVFDAPEGFHFLGVFVQVENLADEPLLFTQFAEKTSIRAGGGTGGFVTFIVGDSVLMPPFSGEFDAGQNEDVGLLFAVSDGSSGFSLLYDSLPPIVLEVKGTE